MMPNRNIEILMCRPARPIVPEAAAIPLRLLLLSPLHMLAPYSYREGVGDDSGN
jgi:hypothetical protein